MSIWARTSEGSVAREPRCLRLGAALVSAVLGGLLLDVATPGIEWWPAAFLGTILVLSAMWQQSVRVGLGAGLIAGAAFWFPHLSWLTLYLGPVPWIGLSAVMTFWFVILGLAVAVATRGIAKLGTRWRSFTAVMQVLTVSGLWMAREVVQSSWPYGGFAWGRLAHTQARGPLSEVVSWVGFTGLTATIVLMCAWAAALLWSYAEHDPSIRWRSASAAALIAVFLTASVVPVASLPETGSLRVAAVQGNSKSGIFDDRDSGDVLRDHVAETDQLIDDLEERGESVDVIVWPENSAEFGIRENRFGGLQLARLSQRAHAPIVIGTVLPRENGTYTNSSLVWGPDGEVKAPSGDELAYDKRYPVPFAEYMPHRSFYHALAPELVDLVQLEYESGSRPAAMNISSDSSDFMAGLAICFDIIFDAQAGAMVDEGAEVIFAQTNNADFGRTDESAQQLQIAHLRAVETGRALVNISTVGTSAIVLPDGTEIDRLVPHTADYLLGTVPLVSGKTPALMFGATITACWLMVGMAGLILGIRGARPPKG